MKILQCIFCKGELDIIGNFKAYVKKIKCRSCGFSNGAEIKPEPEILIIRKRS